MYASTFVDNYRHAHSCASELLSWLLVSFLVAVYGEGLWAPDILDSWSGMGNDSSSDGEMLL